jgi:hypothetical protein
MVSYGSPTYLYFPKLTELVNGVDPSSNKIIASPSPATFSTGTQFTLSTPFPSSPNLDSRDTFYLSALIGGTTLYVTASPNNNYLTYQPLADPGDQQGLLRQQWIVNLLDPNTLDLVLVAGITITPDSYVVLANLGTNTFLSFDPTATNGNLLITQNYNTASSTQRPLFVVSMIGTIEAGIQCCFPDQPDSPANQFCDKTDSNACSSFAGNYCLGENLTLTNCISYANANPFVLDSNYYSFCQGDSANYTQPVCACYVPRSFYPATAVADAQGVTLSIDCVPQCGNDKIIPLPSNVDTCKSGPICIENVTINNLGFTQQQVEDGLVSGITINFSENCGSSPSFIQRYWWIFVIGVVLLIILIVILIFALR